MEYQTILLSYPEPGIALLTMNRPEALNALSDRTVAEVNHAIDTIEADSSLRVVVVTGAGKAFIAGADISYMAGLTAEQARIFARSTTDLYAKMNLSRKVYIAAVNGYAFGGGCEFALGCDLRVASERAKLALPEVSLGVLPGGGGTQRLSRLVGTQKAYEMILTGDPVTAAEALAMGLVCRTAPPEELMDCALNLARRILKNAPLAVQYAKECIRQSEETGLIGGVEYENTMFGLCFASPDQREGMTAFLEKRPAEFSKGF